MPCRRSTAGPLGKASLVAQTTQQTITAVANLAEALAASGFPIKSTFDVVLLGNKALDLKVFQLQLLFVLHDFLQRKSIGSAP